MNDRIKPFKLTVSDTVNIKAAREALIRVRDPAITESLITVQMMDDMKERKELAQYVDEIIADLESLLGY